MSSDRATLYVELSKDYCEPINEQIAKFKSAQATVVDIKVVKAGPRPPHLRVPQLVFDDGRQIINANEINKICEYIDDQLTVADPD